MHLEKHFICGIHISDRLQHASHVQAVFTEYGGFIKTRLGLHDIGDEFNSPNGLVLIEFIDDAGKFAEFTRKMDVIEGVEVQQMVFDHP